MVGQTSILTACAKSTGILCVVKLFQPPVITQSTYPGLSSRAIAAELQACEGVTRAEIFGLVSTQEWTALRMLHYHTSLAQQSQTLVRRVIIAWLMLLANLMNCNWFIWMSKLTMCLSMRVMGYGSSVIWGSTRTTGSRCWTFTDVPTPVEVVPFATDGNSRNGYCFSLCLCHDCCAN
jgi:hypothetical protein